MACLSPWFPCPFPANMPTLSSSSLGLLPPVHIKARSPRYRLRRQRQRQPRLDRQTQNTSAAEHCNDVLENARNGPTKRCLPTTTRLQRARREWPTTDVCGAFLGHYSQRYPQAISRTDFLHKTVKRDEIIGVAKGTTSRQPGHHGAASSCFLRRHSRKLGPSDRRKSLLTQGFSHVVVKRDVIEYLDSETLAQGHPLCST